MLTTRRHVTTQESNTLKWYEDSMRLECNCSSLIEGSPSIRCHGGQSWEPCGWQSSIESGGSCYHQVTTLFRGTAFIWDQRDSSSQTSLWAPARISLFGYWDTVSTHPDSKQYHEAVFTIVIICGSWLSSLFTCELINLQVTLKLIACWHIN